MLAIYTISSQIEYQFKGTWMYGVCVRETYYTFIMNETNLNIN